MVIRIAVLMLAFLLNLSAVAGPLSGGEVPAVGPKSVEIVRNGAWSADISGDETPDMCRAFVLRQADVSAFFKRASRVTARAYSHDLDAANCYAEGSVRLAGGGAAKWRIDQARRGFISMPDGRTLYLYCPKCRADVFAPN
ncbi:hypothetical protein DIE14_21450 [Burkholderia sp. Bp9017]|uniref:Lipoprotein n=1 Tax=Burkholderia anthina TaxID=179879 RepID=A0A7T6VE76_9BURK|nr:MULTISPECIES: hypothetical protein [Burkholderia]MBY4870536.1 hypothetical protein [Burkholderia anthina]QQK02189.1 hypothetical protein JFN94_14040 [Burkholderia anthina]RQZ24443.1 hypothetical protein DIE14_21450 [Burkholderia sp. Bp9017]RQZ32418.1 hypothetical protein DIE13_21330 [Burkholderia sp. Bp9016]